MSPQRIQLSRRKGWRKPENTVVVARPSKWGNPFRVGHPDPVNGEPIETRSQAVARFELHVGPMGSYEFDLEQLRSELAGKNLACWCPPDEPCHADVLLELANAEVSS